MADQVDMPNQKKAQENVALGELEQTTSGGF